MRDFESLLVADIDCARIISPAARHVDMPIEGFVGMVDRDVFDEWLRTRAANLDAERCAGNFETLSKT